MFMSKRFFYHDNELNHGFVIRYKDTKVPNSNQALFSD